MGHRRQRQPCPGNAQIPVIPRDGPRVFRIQAKHATRDAQLGDIIVKLQELAALRREYVLEFQDTLT